VRGTKGMRFPDRKTKHGHAKRGPHDNRRPAREYDAWVRMIRRCTNPKDSQYARYGGRGITVCSRWIESVEAFIADTGPRPSSLHSLDRKDNDKGYELDNCRWATATEQANNRRTNLFIEIDGQRHTLAEWSRSSGMDPRTLRRRIADGMDPKEALTKPLRNTRRSA
jgi:hypothetical protein